MEKTEAKKALYKQKPIAEKQPVTEKGIYHYKTKVLSEDGYDYVINFKVPVSEMGDTFFNRLMPAQLLIRWMQ